MKSSRRIFLIALSFICLTAQASAQTKVLFLGNSITKHGPKADIDWKGNWGMAASAEAND
jgi:alpha-galactosidase